MTTARIQINSEKIRNEITNNLVKQMIRVGEMCVVEARSNGSYTDQTGNLRNSVGYVVLLDGKIKHKSNINHLNAKQVDEIVIKYPQGIVLIVVAGMNYAAYVEAKNYNVLTSAELLAEQILPTLLKGKGISIENV